MLHAIGTIYSAQVLSDFFLRSFSTLVCLLTKSRAMSNDQQNDSSPAPPSDRCDQKAKFWRVKSARKSARTASAIFNTSFDFYPCRKHGCFHLATSRRRARPPPDPERPLTAPTKEQEEAAGVGSRAIARLIDARKGRKNGDMSIQMIPVKSSNVRAIGLDLGNGPMRIARILVQFDNGVYECMRCDASEANAAMAFERFLAAESKGKFYNEFIRRAAGVWNVRKLDTAEEGQTVSEIDEAIEATKAVKEVEKQQAVSRFETAPVPRSLVQTIKEMLEVVPESEIALRERLMELQALANAPTEGYAPSVTLSATEEIWMAMGRALTLHVGDHEKLEGISSNIWKLRLWQLLQNYEADTRQSQEEAARHKFAVNYNGIRRLILTVGLPRGGKTRWARATGFPIVSPDAIRLALHGQAYEPLAEPFVWATTRLMVRALFLAGHETVVLDACSVTRARRDEWRGSEWETFCVLIDTPLEECMKRAEPDEWQDWEGKRMRIPKLTPVIRAMAAKFEPLGEDEQVWTGSPMLFNVGELKGLIAYPTSEGREVVPRYANMNERAGLTPEVLSTLPDDVKPNAKE